MTKQSLFPYYAETLRNVRGVEVLDVDGAAMLHFDNIEESQPTVSHESSE